MEAARAMLYDDAGLAALKRSQLVELCKQFSIKVKGKNTDLIEKLKEHGRLLLKGADETADPIDALSPSKSPLRRTESQRQLRSEAQGEPQQSCSPPAVGSFSFGGQQAEAFEFTFTTAKPTLATSQSVIDELNARVAALAPSVPRPVQSTSPVATFNKKHNDAFGKMDSIAHHYAAKRPLDRSQHVTSNKRQRVVSTASSSASTSGSRSIIGSSSSVVSGLRTEGWLSVKPSTAVGGGRKAIDKARALRKSRSPRKTLATRPLPAPASTLPFPLQTATSSESAAPSRASSFARPTLSSLARSSPVKRAL